MAEDKPSLHIDTDWKKQAQEEKQRLVEQEQKRAQEQQQRAAAPPIGAMGGMAGLAAEVAATTGGAAPAGASRGPARGGRRETPEASLPSLVQSIMTQVLYYLGDLAPRGAEPNLNLDMAKHHIDTLGMLEEKTKGNLTPEEQRTLDGALYETRMRFVSVASQLMGP
jgi:hypothetical protein